MLECKHIKNCNNKAMYLTVNDIDIIISYDSVVAIYDARNIQILIDRDVRKSKTTSKHINNYIKLYDVDIVKNYISNSDFEILIDYILKDNYSKFCEKCFELKEDD